MANETLVKNALDRIVVRPVSGREDLHPVLSELRRLIDVDRAGLHALLTEELSKEVYSAKVEFLVARANNCSYLLNQGLAQLQHLTALHARLTEPPSGQHAGKS